MRAKGNRLVYTRNLSKLASTLTGARGTILRGLSVFYASPASYHISIVINFKMLVAIQVPYPEYRPFVASGERIAFPYPEAEDGPQM